METRDKVKEELPKYYDEPEEMTWSKAMTKYQYHPDYRMMTKEELSAQYKNNSKEYLKHKADYYWSSSENDHNFAWIVNFNNGNATSYGKYYTARVRVILREKKRGNMETKTLKDMLFQTYELGVQQTDCDLTKKANTIMMLANQRVIEELDSLEEHIRECGKETAYEYIRERINELKQE